MSHRVPDAVPVVGGRAERYAAARPAADPAFPWVWFLVTVCCLAVLAGVSKVVLSVLLEMLRAWGWISW